MKITMDWLKERNACFEGRLWFDKNLFVICGAESSPEAKDVLKELLAQDQLPWVWWMLVHVLSYHQLIQLSFFAAETALKSLEGVSELTSGGRYDDRSSQIRGFLDKGKEYSAGSVEAITLASHFPIYSGWLVPDNERLNTSVHFAIDAVNYALCSGACKIEELRRLRCDTLEALTMTIRSYTTSGKEESEDSEREKHIEKVLVRYGTALMNVKDPEGE